MAPAWSRPWKICSHAADQIIANDEANILILSDRGIDREHAPIPALLAVSGLHHHLIRKGTRTHIGLVVESGEPREVHHFAMLIGYGAVAINPYLAFASIEEMINQGLLTGIDYHDAANNYTKAVIKGVVKVISKMGISTIQSYCGAQIFEAVGLSQEFIDKYFTGTPSRIGGVGIDVISREAAMRHAHAFPDRPVNGRTLDAGGQYQWREDGEHHLFNPETVYKLQQACRNNDYQIFQRLYPPDQRPIPPPGHPARPAGFQVCRTAHPARGGGAGRSRSCGASRPGPCLTARSARKPTKRWRSP